MKKTAIAVCCVLGVWGAPVANAQDAELAQKLSNPVANLISVPFQFNYDGKIGPAENGNKYYVNVQPVIPISLNAEWNVISRTILPIVSQSDIFPGAGDQFGTGNITQSLFLSPKAPTAGGIIWGAGPVIYIPTASDSLLGGNTWGGGMTGVVLKQDGGWTYGVLANHIWSNTDDPLKSDLSNTYMQPFLSYTTANAWTYGINLESNYNWVTEQWSVPVNLTISKLVKFGDQPVQLGAGVRYWLATPDGTGPEGFGARVTVTFLFPTGG
jgi:hypothetical protein